MADCDHLLEADDLYCGDDDDHVDVPCEHRAEEYRYHDEGPYRTRDESLLLLLVL